MICSVSARLGWSNPDTGPESLRLYALDAGPSPRWAKPHARVVETAFRERGVAQEGSQAVVVLVDEREGVDPSLLERCRAAAEQAVAEVLANP